jgi:hypothetical protein
VLLAARYGRGVPRVRTALGTSSVTVAATKISEVLLKGVPRAQRHCGRMYTWNWGIWARRNRK